MAVVIESGLHLTVRPFVPRANVPSPPLGTQEVHVWHTSQEVADLDLAGLRELLSPDEAERAARFRFDKHRAQFTLTRVSLRLLLGSYLQLPPREISLQYADHGKPSLAECPNHQQLDFNLSHTEGMAVFAFTRRRRIGVDIENLRSDFRVDEIAERFFSPAERAGLSNIPLSQRHEIFFRIWTQKEAYIKALGEGLSHPLHQFDVSLGDAALMATRPDPSEAQRWHLQSLNIAPGFAAAVAVEIDGVNPPAR
jgi:4'-phosphopantetheinyl transferase